MRVGQTIEISQVRYEIEKRVGEGSFGQVFKARNLANQKEVAIKTQREMSSEEENLMQIMKGKNFRNLINVYDFTRDQQSNYLIIMEYCTESLFDRLQKSKIKPDEIRFIMKEIANGIKELHDLKLAHRDIKPENILIQQIIDSGGQSQEIYKLCDFGTAKQVDVMKTAKIGTPYYLAPEQISHNSQNGYNQKVDIWAFGAVIYELLTGHPLFNGYSEDQVWNKIKNSRQEEINQIIDKDMKIERKYRTLLNNMLLIDSSKRYSIEQVVKDLRADSVIVTRGQPLFNKKEIPTTSQPNPIKDLPAPNQLLSKQKEAIPVNFQNIAQNQQKIQQLNNYFLNKEQKDSIQGNVQSKQEEQKQSMPSTIKPFLSPQQRGQNNQSTNASQGINSPNIGNSQTLNNPTNLTINNQFGGRASQFGNSQQNKIQPAQQFQLQNTNKNLEQNNSIQFNPRVSNMEPAQQQKGFENKDQQNQLFQQSSQQNQHNFQDNKISEQNTQNFNQNRNSKVSAQQQNYAFQNGSQQNQPAQQFSQQNQNNFLDNKNLEQNNQNKFSNRTTNIGTQQSNQAFNNGFQQNQPIQQESNNQNQFNYRNSGAQLQNQAFKNGSNINQTNNQFNNFQNIDQPLQPPQKIPPQIKQPFGGQQMLQKEESQNLGTSNQGRMSNFQPALGKQQPSNQITNQTRNAGYFPNSKAMDGLQAPNQMREQHNQQFNQINTQFNVTRGRQ